VNAQLTSTTARRGKLLFPAMATVSESAVALALVSNRTTSDSLTCCLAGCGLGGCRADAGEAAGFGFEHGVEVIVVEGALLSQIGRRLLLSPSS